MNTAERLVQWDETDGLLAADPEFEGICTARRDRAIDHMEECAMAGELRLVVQDDDSTRDLIAAASESIEGARNSRELFALSIQIQRLPKKLREPIAAAYADRWAKLALRHADNARTVSVLIGRVGRLRPYRLCDQVLRAVLDALCERAIERARGPLVP